MTAGHAQVERPRGAPLAKFILSHKGEILARWEQEVRHLPTARELPKPVLLDSVPQLLDSIVHPVHPPAGCSRPGRVEVPTSSASVSFHYDSAMPRV